MALTITPIPAFSDNYIWLISLSDSNQAYVVDPGDGEVVANTLREKGLELAGILITHRHYDHVDGIPLLLDLFPGARVYGPDSDAIGHISHPVGEGDKIELFGQYPLQVLSAAGHTQEHIVYYLAAHRPEDAPLLFSGDTLFAAGCGRLLGGSAEQLHHSLEKISRLPDETLIYCAHEYTMANLDFAMAVDKTNTALASRLEQESHKRAQNHPTIPSVLGIEKQTNPFLRVDHEDIQASLGAHWGKDYPDSQSAFTDLRLWKDQF